MKMISYAQNHEDVILDRLFPRSYRGFYIDIGANHPVHCSLTKHFYDLGWSGINVEPGSICDLLSTFRPRDINLRQAVSDVDGQAVFYEFPTRPTDSTLDRTVAGDSSLASEPCVKHMVEVTTLRRLCKRHVSTRTIDFLSIDVEGHEQAVIQSGDWQRFRPRVVLVEATVPNGRQPAHSGWEPLLLREGYRFALFDGLNRFYVRDEDRDLLPLMQAPVCIFDKFVSYHVLAEYGGITPESTGLQVALLVQKVARRMPWVAAPFRRVMTAVSRRRAA